MMKKLVLATALAALSAASAFAADMPSRGMVAKAPMMAAPVTNWSGLYIGGNVGYGWGQGKTNFTFLPDAATFTVDNTALDTEPKGVIGGAQIGYNWQIGSIVAGIEADIQGSGIKGSATKSPILFNDGTPPLLGSFLSSERELVWFGTLRGRLGTTVMPNTLLYATGGLSYGHINASADTFFDLINHYPASVGTTKVGWTAGAGTEWMFARNWSAKLEYLYVDLGKVSAIANSTEAALLGLFQAAYTWKVQDHIVRAGVNYHF